MLKIRCIQLPCRNIDVSGVNLLIASLSMMQAIPFPNGMPLPIAARLVTSPGTIP